MSDQNPDEMKPTGPTPEQPQSTPETDWTPMENAAGEAADLPAPQTYVTLDDTWQAQAPIPAPPESGEPAAAPQASPTVEMQPPGSSPIWAMPAPAAEGVSEPEQPGAAAAAEFAVKQPFDTGEAAASAAATGMAATPVVETVQQYNPPPPPPFNYVPPTPPSGAGGGGYFAPAAAPPMAAPLTPQEERTWAMLSHLSIVANLFTGFLGTAAALIIYLVFKDRSRYVARQAMQAFLFQLIFFLGGSLVMAVAWAITIPLMVVIVGICLLPLTLLLTALPLAAVGYGVYAAIETNAGKDFRYWLVGGMVEN